MWLSEDHFEIRIKVEDQYYKYKEVKYKQNACNIALSISRRLKKDVVVYNQSSETLVAQYLNGKSKHIKNKMLSMKIGEIIKLPLIVKLKKIKKNEMFRNKI